MASTEFITKRIEGKKAEISKLEKKIARIEKAQESNWENNPYYYTERDLYWANKDLEEAKAALASYEAKLASETEKDQSRNVKAVVDFLNAWADRVYKHYEQAFVEYQREKAEYYKKNHEYCDWANHGGWKDPNGAEIKAAYKAYEKRFHSKWRFIQPYDNKGFDGAKLLKELEQDKKAKYDNIIERTNEITGKITDACGLRVSAKGELNGFIIGERGTAKVETIGAGGYNIQCFHFRTLVHKCA